MPQNEIPEEFIPIPLDRLSDEVLESVVREFILREGTEYGHTDYTLIEKIETVFKQLRAGRARIVFSTLTQNTTILLNETL